MDKINNEKAAGGVETIAAAGDDKQGNSNTRQTPRKAPQDDLLALSSNVRFLPNRNVRR